MTNTNTWREDFINKLFAEIEAISAEGDRRQYILSKEEIHRLTDTLISQVEKEAEERGIQRYVEKLLGLPAKFWEDQDHSVGGYISKKDLKELLSSFTQDKE